MLRQKVGELLNERSAIDVDLDESEMMELLRALKKIVSLDHRKVGGHGGVDQVLSQEIAPLVEKNTTNYFHKKFYAQENKASLEEVSKQAVFGIKPSGGGLPGAGRHGSTRHCAVQATH